MENGASAPVLEDVGTIGSRLQAEMRKKHLTAKQIAETLGFSRNRLGKIIKDEMKPDYITMVGLKAILGLNGTEAVMLFFGVVEGKERNSRTTSKVVIK